MPISKPLTKYVADNMAAGHGRATTGYTLNGFIDTCINFTSSEFLQQNRHFYILLIIPMLYLLISRERTFIA